MPEEQVGGAGITLQSQLGPFKAWQWGLVVVGGYLVYRRFVAPSSSGAAPAATPPAGGSRGGPGPRGQKGAKGAKGARGPRGPKGGGGGGGKGKHQHQSATAATGLEAPPAAELAADTVENHDDAGPHGKHRRVHQANHKLPPRDISESPVGAEEPVMAVRDGE